MRSVVVGSLYFVSNEMTEPFDGSLCRRKPAYTSRPLSDRVVPGRSDRCRRKHHRNGPRGRTADEHEDEGSSDNRPMKPEFPVGRNSLDTMPDSQPIPDVDVTRTRGRAARGPRSSTGSTATAGRVTRVQPFIRTTVEGRTMTRHRQTLEVIAGE